MDAGNYTGFEVAIFQPATLFLTLVRRRIWRGRVREMTASRFLRDIEAGLLEERNDRPKRRRPTPHDTGQLRLL